MASPIPAVQNTATIRDAEFVRLQITFTNGTTQIQRSLFFSTSYRAETFSGQTYTELGALLSISAHQRDISSSGYDTTIAITGLDPEWIYFVAGGPATAPVPVPGQADIPIGYYPMIKGSFVQIRRGFYNSNFVLTGTPVSRYQGLITSYSIQEDRDASVEGRDDNYIIQLQCSSFRSVLENRIAGRRTNSQSWKYFSQIGLGVDDTSMDRVAALEARQFDFGKEPRVGAGASPNPVDTPYDPTPFESTGP